MPAAAAVVVAVAAVVIVVGGAFCLQLFLPPPPHHPDTALLLLCMYDDQVVYFVGRALAKEDDISSITTRIENYNKRVQWVKESAQKIRDNITTKMAAASK